jgi:hypothetical protein
MPTVGTIVDPIALTGLALIGSAALVVAYLIFDFRRLVKKPSKHGGKAQAHRIKTWLNRCPACEQSFKGHSFNRLAVTIFAPERTKDASVLLKAVGAHRWAELMQLQSFDPLLDAYCADVVRCNRVAQLVTLVWIEFFELTAKEELIHLEVLDADSSRELESLVEAGKVGSPPATTWIKM